MDIIWIYLDFLAGSWFIMVYHSLSWFIMGYHGLSFKILGSHHFQLLVPGQAGRRFPPPTRLRAVLGRGEEARSDRFGRAEMTFAVTQLI